jgi:hypothetical protein
VQIGFNTLPWSLTSAGRAWLESNPAITAAEIAANEAAFAQERVPIAWKVWTIYAAGSALIALYSVGFLLWTAGFAFLGITDNSRPTPPAVPSNQHRQPHRSAGATPRKRAEPTRERKTDSDADSHAEKPDDDRTDSQQ